MECSFYVDSDNGDGEDDWDCFDIGAPKPTIEDLSGNEAPYEGSTQWYEVEADDPTGSDLIYTWDFGDGSEVEVYEGSEGEQVSHVFVNDGDYILNVTVTNVFLAVSISAADAKLDNCTVSCFQLSGCTRKMFVPLSSIS